MYLLNFVPFYKKKKKKEKKLRERTAYVSAREALDAENDTLSSIQFLTMVAKQKI